MMQYDGEKQVERIFFDVVNKNFVNQDYRSKTTYW